MLEGFTDISAQLGLPLTLLYILIAWTLIWKGIALWKSARVNHLVWFIVLLIINTFGILEILYIFLFSKMNLGKRRRVTRIKMPSLATKARPKAKKRKRKRR